MGDGASRLTICSEKGRFVNSAGVLPLEYGFALHFIQEPIEVDFQEETLEDAAAVSATVQDSIAFVLDSLDKDVLMSLGHQLMETVPLCTYDGVKCDMKKSVEMLWNKM